MTDGKRTPTPVWKGTKARTLIHISKDGAPVCEISISANHVHEDYPGARKAYIARQEKFAEEIVRNGNSHEALVAMVRRLANAVDVSEFNGLKNEAMKLVEIAATETEATNAAA